MAKMKYWDGKSWVVLDAKDADTLDGKHAADFADAAQFKNHIDNHPKGFSGNYNDLTNKPTSMPANGGNADTVDGKHASDFASTAIATASANGLLSKEDKAKIDNMNQQLNIEVKPVDVEVEGRTLVNLLGRAGNAIYKMREEGPAWKLDFEHDEKDFVGTLNGSATTGSITAIGGAYLNQLKLNKCYIFISEAMCVSCNGTSLSLIGPAIATKKGSSTTGKWELIYTTVKMPSTKPEHCYLDLVVSSNNSTGEGRFRDVRCYEVSEDIFNKINKGEYTDDHIRKEFAYVDDIKCIINPYFESKENLLDGVCFYTTNFDATGADVPSSNSNTSSPFVADALNGEVYTTMVEGEYAGKFGHEIYNLSIASNSLDNKASAQKPSVSATITCNKNGRLRVFIPTAHIEDGLTYEMVKNSINAGRTTITLTSGTVAKKYAECQNSRLMLETKVYSGEKVKKSNSGNYVKIGQYGEIDNIYDLPIMSDVALDGGSRYIRFDTSGLLKDAIDTESYMIGGDGLIINRVSMMQDDIMNGFSFPDATLRLTLPERLTGWGPSYKPTAEEIKAFFLGWRMYAENGNATWQNWNDQAGWTKIWVKAWCGVGERYVVEGFAYCNELSNRTKVCPTTMNDRGYIPYRLIYKNNFSKIDAVKTHGCLVERKGIKTTHGSGLIVGYKAPYAYHAGATKIFINGGQAQFKAAGGHRVEDFIAVYNDKNEIIPPIEKQFAPAEWILRTGIFNYGFSADYKPTYYTDYLIYKYDTVQEYSYTIISPKDTKKTIENLSYGNKQMNISNTPVISNPNILSNGEFNIWQRGESFLVPANTGVYTADRWWVGGNFPKVEVSKTENQQLKVEVTEDPKDSHDAPVVQHIPYEEVVALRGKQLTFSVNLTHSPGIGDVVISLYYGTKKYQLTCAEGRTEVHKVIKHSEISRVTPKTFSITGPVVPDNTNGICVIIRHTSSYGATKPNKGEYFSVNWAKLEIGDLTTPLTSKSIGEDLAACKRYYQEVYRTEVSGVAGNNQLRLIGYFQYQNELREAPSRVDIVPNFNSNEFNMLYAVKPDGGADVVSVSKIDCQCYRSNGTVRVYTKLTPDYIGASCVLKLDAEIY